MPQPSTTLLDPVSLSKPLERWGFGLTYVKATADVPEPDDSPMWRAYRHAVTSAAWNSHEFDCNHMIPELRPADLAKLLTLSCGSDVVPQLRDS